jgi:hypothetical protein
MSNLNHRLEKLEQQHGPSDKIYIVVYDSDGRATHGSIPTGLIGKTREEINAMVEADKSITTLSVAVYLPDNERSDTMPGEP